MKIKCTTDDFQVEELTAVQTQDAGPFALYRLDKRGWTTPDALSAIRRRWRIETRRLSYGGLKDRHAHTVQHFTIFHGPNRKLTHQGFDVAYLGQVPEPFTSEQMSANRFSMVLRDLSDAELAYARQELPLVREHGVPNYFDDQRFGSMAGGGSFVARLMLEGQYEDALRQALTAAYPFDRKQERVDKARLRSHWGDWARAKEQLSRSHARSLVDYLSHHPDDFRGALARLRPELRGLYLAAYQSHLWNRMLAGWLSSWLPPGELLPVELALGPVPMPRMLGTEQRAMLLGKHLPLHSPKVQMEEDDPVRPFFEGVLNEEGLTLDQFRLRGFKEMFFSRGERAAWCVPIDLRWDEANDELYPGRDRLTLYFDLQRGSYATLLVKRITM